MEPNRYTNHLSFLDLLFLTLLGFVFLFMIAFLRMNPPSSDKITPKAELLITADWSIKHPHDIDLWVLTPDGIPVGFSRMKHMLIHLEHDDQGEANDVIQTPEGMIKSPYNHEVMTFRALIPGSYVVNVHFYDRHASNNHDEDEDGVNEPVPITVELIQINPSFSSKGKVIVKLNHIGDEATAFQFIITKEGKITDVSTNPNHFVYKDVFGGSVGED